VAFTPQVDLVFTFTDASQKGGDRLEVLAFNEHQLEFELYEVTFQNHRANLSRKNPAQCLRCHGSPPRPNWQEYPSWPGFYGSFDDKLVTAEKEDAGIAQLISRAPQHPRYRHLFEIQKSFSPRASTPGSGARNAGRRNSHLTEGLGYLNLKRILKTTQDHPSWPTLKYDIISNLLNCRGNSASVQSQNFREILDNAGLDSANFSMGFNPTKTFTMPSSFESTFLYLLLQAEADLAARFNTLSLKKDPPSVEPHYPRFDDSTTQAMHNEFCRKPPGTEKSDSRTKGVLSDQALPPIVALRCAHCHSSTAIQRGIDINAPEIPFDDPAKLKAWLTPQRFQLIRQQISAKGSATAPAMPPVGAPMDARDQKKLLNYLELLSSP
jgi:hypothetical protein